MLQPINRSQQIKEELAEIKEQIECCDEEDVQLEELYHDQEQLHNELESL